MDLVVPDLAAVVAAMALEPTPPKAQTQPAISISVIKPRPECFETFVAMQLSQHARLRGQVEGLRGGRLFKSRAAGMLVLVTMFESAEAAQRFSRDKRFTEHLERVRPLIETADAAPFELAYAVGEI